MPLSQSDRVVFSSQLVAAPASLAADANGIAATNSAIASAQSLDNAHMDLITNVDVFVNKYEAEIKDLTGYPRNTLTEQMQQDASNQVVGNLIYPNNPSSPPPSLAPNVWTQTVPYARNVGVGKFFNEQYGTQVDGELNMIASIQADIASIVSYQPIERVTGDSCNNGSTCSLPSYTTESSCTSNSGTWYSSDTIAPNPALQALLSDIKSKVSRLQAVLNTELNDIYTADPDATRRAQAIANHDDITTNILPAIATWLALADTAAYTGANTCSAFYATDPNSLGATKLRVAELSNLATAITNRLTFANTRITQVNGYLGTVTQSLTDGSVTGSGFYFQRWGFVKLRLNLIGGSLFLLNGLKRSIGAQQQNQANTIAATNIYSGLLTCSILAAPSNGTQYLQLASAAGISAGDNVFLCSNTQAEISLSVIAVVGNRIQVGSAIPAKYLPAESARVYKDLT